MSQTDRLLGALSRGPMTSLEIWRQLGIARAGARVFDLKGRGIEVITELVEVTNRYGDMCKVARYHLGKLPNQRRKPRAAKAAPKASKRQRVRAQRRVRAKGRAA